MRALRSATLLGFVTVCSAVYIPLFAKDKGCSFSQISAIPSGKAALYFFKNSYGRDSYPVALDGEMLLYLHNGGFYSMIVDEGEHKIQLDERQPVISSGTPLFGIGKGVSGKSPFLGAPAMNLTVESGKSYYLEL